MPFSLPTGKINRLRLTASGWNLTDQTWDAASEEGYEAWVKYRSDDDTTTVSLMMNGAWTKQTVNGRLEDAVEFYSILTMDEENDE